MAAAMKRQVVRRMFALSLGVGTLSVGLMGMAIAPSALRLPGISAPAFAQSLPQRLAWTEDYATALEAQTDLVLRRQSLAQTLTRVEFAQWLTEFFGYAAEPTRVVQIADIEADTPDYWTAQAVLQAGVMRTYDGNDFRPEGDMTKLEAIAIFARVLQLPTPNEAEIDRWMDLYNDTAGLPEVGRTFIAMAAQAELLLNVPDPAVIEANLVLSRGEGAALLHQALAYRQRVRSLEPPIAQLVPAQPQKPELLATRIQPESGVVPAGREVVVEARATAGSRASATIAQRQIAMREVEPGLYRGSYRVTGSDAIANPAVSIQISRNGESTRVQRQLPQLTLGSTSTPPTAAAPTRPNPTRPAPNQPAPTGSDVTRSDVTRSDVTRSDATRPTLPESAPRNSLPPIREDGYPTFTAIRIDPSRDLEAGDVFAVAIQGTPGGFAQFDLGSVARNVTMRETQPGRYEGTYTIASGDRADRPFVQVVMSKNGFGVRHRELFPFTIAGNPSLVSEVSDANPPAPRATPIARPLPSQSAQPLAGLGRQPKIYEAAFNGVNRELKADDVLRVTMHGNIRSHAHDLKTGATAAIASHR
ncbi:MAG: hypothetical protein AAFX40_16090, partial [Cyanobacteria bacterium J06639_1]